MAHLYKKIPPSWQTSPARWIYVQNDSIQVGQMVVYSTHVIPGSSGGIIWMHHRNVAPASNLVPERFNDLISTASVHLGTFQRGVGVVSVRGPVESRGSLWDGFVDFASRAEHPLDVQMVAISMAHLRTSHSTFPERAKAALVEVMS